MKTGVIDCWDLIGSDSLMPDSFQFIQSGLAAEAASTSAVAEPVADGGPTRFYRVREE
jgi:hypothetical protein